MRLRVSRIGILDEKLPPSLELEIEKGATVREVVAVLEERYGGIEEELYSPGSLSSSSLREGCRILLNGRSIGNYKGLETAIEKDSRLLLTILIHGG